MNNTKKPRKDYSSEATKGIMAVTKGLLSLRPAVRLKRCRALAKMAALGPLGAITSAATLLFKQLTCK